MSSGKWQPFCLGLNVLIIDILRIAFGILSKMSQDIIGVSLHWFISGTVRQQAIT